jgi:hypothetical protein
LLSQSQPKGNSAQQTNTSSASQALNSQQQQQVGSSSSRNSRQTGSSSLQDHSGQSIQNSSSSLSSHNQQQQQQHNIMNHQNNNYDDNDMYNNNNSHQSSSLLSSSNRANQTPNKFQTMTKRESRDMPALRKKGEFSLDLPGDDDDRNGDIQIKLTKHSDLDELLNQPVEMPPPRKNVSAYPVSILKESQDCHEAIDLVITHISHQKLDVSFQNLVQIDVVIKDRDKKDLLVPHIDNLLNTCALKLNVAHTVYLNSDYQVDEVFRLFKGLFSVVLDIFENDL